MRPALLRAAVLVLAVALGVALGAGPLQQGSRERRTQVDRLEATVARRDARIADLRRAISFGDQYAAATAGRVVTGALAGRTVAIVSLPGADKKTVDALAGLVGTARGRVVSRVELAPSTATASSRQLVEALTSQMVTQVHDLKLAADASGYERLGALLARAIGATSGTGTAYDPTAVSIVSGLQTAQLVTVRQQVAARAAVVLVVAGPEARTTKAAEQNVVPMTVLRGLGESVGTVVAGTTGAAGKRGVVGLVRATPSSARVMSTTDGVETAAGRALAILALAARSRGVGHYGATGATGPVPGASRATPAG